MLNLKTLGAKLTKTSLGIVTSQALSFAFIPVLSRLYNPSNFALYGSYIAVVGILSAISTGKFHDAISTIDSRSWSRSLISLSFKIVFVFTMTISIPTIGYFYCFFNSSLAGFLCLGSIIAVSANNIALQILMKEARYSAYSFQIFCTIGLPSIIQAFLSNNMGLILGSFIAHSIGALAAIWAVAHHLPKLSFVLSSREKSIARRFSSFPLYSLPSLLIMLLRTKLPYFIFPQMSNISFLGFYSQADRLLSAPTSLFAIAFKPIVTEALSGKKEVSHILLNLLRIQWFTLPPFLALIIVFSKEIFSLLLGNAWAETSAIFDIMAVPAFLMMTTSWLDRFFDFKAKHKSIFGTELFFGLTTFIVLQVMASISTAPFKMLWFYSASLTLYYVAWIFKLNQVIEGSPAKLARIMLLTVINFSIFYGLFCKLKTWNFRDIGIF